MKILKNNKRKERAITLIALVITIVVLIILAAVAINLSLGNNGIFNRAKTGKELYQNAEESDRTDIAKATNKIDSYVGGDRTSGNANNNYSYDEQIIGTWVDGSPLYQKTFDLGSDVTFAGNSWTTTTIPTTGIKMIVSVDASASFGTYFQMSAAIDVTPNTYVHLTSFRNSNLKARYITLKYVKN